MKGAMKMDENQVTASSFTPIAVFADPTPPAANTTNILASISFTLIGTDLTAAFSKSGDAYEFLIIPTSLDTANGMSIKEMVDQVNDLINKSGAADIPQVEAADITKSLDDLKSVQPDNNTGGFDPTAIRVKLQQAFLYYYHKPGPDPANPDQGAENIFEYAFQLVIITEGLFPANFSIFNLKEVSVAIWKTGKKKILERMRLVNIKDYLAENA